jgi:maltose O-acetyltransferase
MLAPMSADPDDTRTMRERMLAGDPYIADDPDLAEASARALDLAEAYNRTSVRQGPLRRQLLTELLGGIGEGTEIRPPLSVDYGSHLRIGSRCSIGDDVWPGGGVIVLPGVTIGENTVVGAGAVVTRDLPADVVAVGNPARVVRSPAARHR